MKKMRVIEGTSQLLARKCPGPDVQTLIVQLRQRKEVIGLAKRQLEEEEQSVDDKIARLEENEEQPRRHDDIVVYPRPPTGPPPSRGLPLTVTTRSQVGRSSPYALSYDHNHEPEEGEGIAGCFEGTWSMEDAQGEEHMSLECQESDVEEANEKMSSKKTWKKQTRFGSITDEDIGDFEDRWEGSRSEWQEWYANLWLQNDGDVAGIPKPYTPCLYFWKAKGGCKDYRCAFSHSRIFAEEKYADLMRNLSWPKKERKFFNHVLLPHPPGLCDLAEEAPP